MINDIQSYIQSKEYISREVVEGGSDMEVNDFHNNPTNTRAWAHAYSNTPNAGWGYQDYGDASGCPTSGTTGTTPGPCNNGWTQDDVYDVAWHEIAAFPLPEIYSKGTTPEPYGGDADEWQQLSKYAYNKDGMAMSISGPLTQQAACADMNPTNPEQACPGTDNSPTVGWNQLYKALNLKDPATVQGLPFLTDITYKN